MNVRLFLCLIALTCSIPTTAQEEKIVKGVRISQIDDKELTDSLLVFEEVYNPAGQLTSKTLIVDDPTPILLTQKFNEAFVLLKEEKTELDGTPIEDRIYIYDYSGVLKKRQIVRAGSDTISQTVHQVRGPENLLIKQVYVGQGTSVLNGHEIYSYDQNNEVQQIAFYLNKKLVKEVEFVRDEKGQLKEHFIKFTNPALLVKTTFKYKKGNIVQEKRYTNGDLDAVKSYTLDNNGKVQLVTTTYPENDSKKHLIFFTESLIPVELEAPQQPEVSRGEEDVTAEKP